VVMGASVTAVGASMATAIVVADRTAAVVVGRDVVEVVDDVDVEVVGGAVVEVVVDVVVDDDAPGSADVLVETCAIAAPYTDCPSGSQPTSANAPSTRTA
jgi:hypothetical protein